MKKRSTSQKLFLEEIFQTGNALRSVIRGLSIGELVAIIRKQLGMSQKVLAKRAQIPQSTVSRIEQGKKTPQLTTVRKILAALSCDLLLVPVSTESIDDLRLKQACRIAEKHVRYLRGTMSLEEQEPDSRFLKELIRRETEDLLRSKTKLWEEDEKY